MDAQLHGAVPARRRTPLVFLAGVRAQDPPLPDVVSLQCRQPSLEGTGEIKLRRLVQGGLRMRPSPSSSARSGKRRVSTC